MNYAGTIRRLGAPALWRPMAGAGKTYDTTTGTMVGAAPPTPKKIYVLVEGFGSVESQLRFQKFVTGELVATGAVRLFLTENVKIGDVITLDGTDYTVIYGKSVWFKNKVVLYEIQCQQ